MQYFANHSKNIEWKYNVAFNLENMKIMGMYQKKRIEMTIYPGDEQLILITQEGGKDYKLSGGEGTCDFIKLHQNYNDMNKNEDFYEDSSELEDESFM